MKNIKTITMIILSTALISCSGVPKKSPCGALDQSSTPVLAFTADNCGELKAINKS